MNDSEALAIAGSHGLEMRYYRLSSHVHSRNEVYRQILLLRTLEHVVVKNRAIRIAEWGQLHYLINVVGDTHSYIPTH